MKKSILFFTLLLVCLSCFAQTGDVKGFVYDESNGEPIIFTNVYLEGTSIGAATDINGYYSISKITPGDYTLMCTYIGYDTARISISILPNKLINQKIFLKEGGGINLDVVEISAEKQEARTEVKTSTINVSPKQINKIPAVGGEPDLAQYLQVLPGVVFTGDQGGQLYIRGGSPIQTKVLLDGLTIYNPFHSIGLFSVFETDIIKNVEVNTGGFSAEHGGRISAVVDVSTKDGNKKELEGKVSFSPMMSKVVLQGPIVPLKESGTSVSYVLAVKNSYLDRSSKVFYPYINSEIVNSDEGDAEDQGLPYKFNDVFAKISLNSNNGNKLSLFGYDYRDNTNFNNITQYDWKANGGGFNFVVVPSKSNFLINGKFAYSKYTIEQSGEDDSRSNVGGFNFILDFNYFLRKGKLKYGIDVAGFNTLLVRNETTDSANPEEENATDLAAFAVYKLETGKLVIEPSLRVVNYAALSSFQLEPRFGLKYNITDRFRFKCSGGRFTQDLLSTKSDQDIVGLFTGFVTVPNETLGKYNEDGVWEEVEAKVQIANHAIAGFEVDVTKKINLNVEGYYKDYEQLVNVNRNKTAQNDPDWIAETGEAYGIDFLLKYDYKRLYLWGVYSLGFVNRVGPNGAGGIAEYPPHYDRRHNMNLLASYTAGKNLGWELSARWNLGSGLPFTRTQGFYESVDFRQGIGTDYTTANANEVSIIYDEKLNGGRLPFYHRLDISAKKKLALTPNINMDIVASVTNVYDRQNIFFFDRIKYTRVNQLPILPSLGISLSF